MSWWIAETFAWVTLLMLLVLAVRRPVARMFGAGWSYALWAIPALRLIVPPLPLITPEIQLPAIVAPAMAEAAASPIGAEVSLSWTALLLAVWAGGAILFLTLQWLGYRAFLRRLRSDARPARPSQHGGISTLISRAVDGPVALGFLERLIVLPGDFSRRYSPGERRLAIEHELTHHRRGDTWWNLAAMVVLALNWFNPIAWIAFRAFREDQELSCDAAVAGRAGPDERHDYALALVKSASSPGTFAACPLTEAARLKRRLRMMRSHRASPARRAGGSVALAALAAAGFAVGSPAFVGQELPAAGRLAEAVPVAAPAPAAVAAAAPAPARLAAAAPAPAAKPAAKRVRKPAGARKASAVQAAPEPALFAAVDPAAGLLPELVARPPRPGPEPRIVIRQADGAGKTFVVVASDLRELKSGDQRRVTVELRRAIVRARKAQEALDRPAQPAGKEGPGGNFTNFQILTIEQGEDKKCRC